MFELAALCIVIYIGVPLAIMAATAALVIVGMLAKAAAYVVAAPFMLAWQILLMFADIISWTYDRIARLFSKKVTQ